MTKIRNFFNELLLNSGQYALFYILMNFSNGLAPEIPKFFPKNSYSIGKSIRRAIISNKFKIV